MAQTLLAANNASTVLATSIGTAATTLLVSTGTGAKFPSPVSGQSYFKITLTDASTGKVREIMHVTSRSGDTLVVDRAQEGTEAIAWAASALVSNLFTAGSLDEIAQKVDVEQVYSSLAGSETGEGAALIGVKQPYSGAISRTQSDKNMEYPTIGDFGARPGISNSDATTLAFINAFSDESLTGLTIPPFAYYIDASILSILNNVTINARGAKLYSSFDGVMFDLNKDADPSNIEGTSKSYINWFGGTFQSLVSNPSNSVALRAYGIRQANIENCIFGNSGNISLNSGVQIAGLGGHTINKNRFLLVDEAIDCPKWATSSTDVSGPITTSRFEANNFILASGQKAFHVRGGWNRWIIQGGFMNGSGAALIHFTNYADCKGLNLIGVGCEQAIAGGKFLYIQDTSGGVSPLTPSSINISGSSFSGDPTGGGHTAIELERCINVSIGEATRVEGSLAKGNNSIRCDANCRDIVIDPSCRLPDPGVTLLMPRIYASVGKTFQRISDQVLTGYNGDAKSSSTVTLDMKTLLGSNYPTQAAPLAYDLTVQARDSGSAASTTAQVEVMRSLTGTSTFRNIINLQGRANSQRVGGSIHVNADTDGNIAMQFTSSGTLTLEVWVYVTAIYN